MTKQPSPNPLPAINLIGGFGVVGLIAMLLVLMRQDWGMLLGYALIAAGVDGIMVAITAWKPIREESPLPPDQRQEHTP